MDKFTNSIWFTRIVSFALAALLFISVNFEMEADKKSMGLSTAPEYDTETIENVPVEVYYDRENLVVSGVPDTVDVTLSGAKSLLIAAKNQREFKVYLDLSDPEITMGTRTVSYKISGLNEKLKATIEPESANVDVQERVTKEFSVEPEYNKALLEDGYIAENPTVDPQTVKITGAKDVIDQISYVKATIGLDSGVEDSVNGEATVRALDRDLNKLDVTIEPAKVQVGLKISIPSKSVSLSASPTGKPKDGLKIKSINIDPGSVTLFGSESVLDDIEGIDVPVDVSKVDGDTDMEVDIPQPDKVRRMSVQKLKVTVLTEKPAKDTPEEEKTETETETETSAPKKEEEPEEETETAASVQSKTFEGIPIKAVGIQNDQEVQIEPETVNVTLTGKEEDMEKVSKSDISLTVDASELDEGTHTVEISVNSPENTEWELSADQAEVTIEKKEES
ncbi:CdaR family protein [Bacillus massiliglaciei]|uniref:CdaR family protein n=1 Tax=Bacillus massiliglaciei TaxID=1816693 RepID=UPI000AF01CB0|nr:CdaR family protein [Bacillus massiliglaciei]